MLSPLLSLFKFFKVGDLWVVGPFLVTFIVLSDLRTHTPIDGTTGVLVVVMLVAQTLLIVLGDLIARAKRAV